MISSTRIIFNTSVQYIRTIFSLVISLYTTRLILDALGIHNYGVFALLSGIVSMLSFIQVSLSQSTQRYLSYHQGRGDFTTQKIIFNNSVITQIILGTLLIIILTSIIPNLFGGWLNIEETKKNIAIGTYLCMLGMVFISMQATPYIASLISHENIFYTSIIDLVNTILRIPVAFMLYNSPVDRLLYFGILSLGIQFIIFLLYFYYCRNYYAECRKINLLKFDKIIFTEMMSFVGWNIYSTGCIVARTQGFSILINRLSGIMWNAAWGIGNQLSSQISFISLSLQNAIRPQLIKAEGAGDRQRMIRLSQITSKFSFLLLSMVSIPLFFEMPQLLSVWLKSVPNGTVLFCQMLIIVNLVDQLTTGLSQANQAIGQIRKYSLLFYTPKLLLLPLAYLILKNNGSMMIVMVAFVSIELIVAIARLPFFKHYEKLSITDFSRKVYLPAVIPFSLTIVICWAFSNLSNSFMNSLFTMLLSSAVMSVSTYLVGLCEDEKVILKSVITKILAKIHL